MEMEYLETRSDPLPPHLELEDLFDSLYQDLRRLARSLRRRQVGPPTLVTTALVHEAYVKLEQNRPGVVGRRHFFALAARAMRFVLRDEARARGRLRRGGGLERVALEEAAAEPERFDAQILALDRAFEALAQARPRLARVVEYRFYAGLSLAETAELLEVSTMTVKRDWTKARALLARALGER